MKCLFFLVLVVALASNVPIRAQPKELPKDFTNSIGMKFVWIPPGNFMMGIPKEQKERFDSLENTTQKKVTLTKGFYLSAYTVTQEQWQEIMGKNPSHFKGEKSLPVESVSWGDCQEFIKKLRGKKKKPYRLPTEAEWEYACRAGTTTPFHFGETISTDQANYNGNQIYGNGKAGKYREKTMPVGSFPANAWGLHDMHGNVWQWCEDWFWEPKKDVVGNMRMLRGGSWNDGPRFSRSAYRHGEGPDAATASFGFRLCFFLDAGKLLDNPKPQVRLKAALALVERQDEEAIGVLVELLADLTHDERRQAEEALQELAGAWAPNTARLGDDEMARRNRRDAWAAWWGKTDGPALLAAFRKQTLNAEESDNVKRLIARLGDSVYATRERATGDLLTLGNKVVPSLREATPTADLEHKRRIENCLKQLAERQDKNKLPLAAARLLAIRKPAGATEALLAYLGFTDDEEMHSEIAAALISLTPAKGKPDPLLVKALRDPSAVRRAIAAEVLAAVGDAEHRAAVRKLLTDAVPAVRLRAAVARAGDKEAVPVLIDMVVAWSSDEQVCQARELLHRLAGAKAPKRGRTDEPVPTEKYRAAWKAWWEQHAATVDLAPLEGAVLRKAKAFSARASKSWEERNQVPIKAFENLGWNAGDFAPQWIEADLRVSRHLGAIHLEACQSGRRQTHEVWLANEPIGDDRTKAKLVHTFQGNTKDGDEFAFTFPKGVSGRYVQIRTTESREWVNWHFIELRVR